MHCCQDYSRLSLVRDQADTAMVWACLTVRLGGWHIEALGCACGVSFAGPMHENKQKKTGEGEAEEDSRGGSRKGQHGVKQQTAREESQQRQHGGKQKKTAQEKA